MSSAEVPTGSPGSIGGIQNATVAGDATAFSALLSEWQYGAPMTGLSLLIETVTTIGLAGLAARPFEESTVCTLDRDLIKPLAAPDDADVLTDGPATAEYTLSETDVVFVTGSTVLYGGFDRYLAPPPSDATMISQV